MNKKIIVLALSLITLQLDAHKQDELIYTLSTYDVALTSGYIWKNDPIFQEVYGSGIANILTIDTCYYPFDHAGVGIKFSWWEKQGKTTVLQQPTTLHEFPLITYLRGRIGTRLQGYASLGAGVIFIREQSYIGYVSTNNPIAEAEIGLNFHIKPHAYVTAAVQMLFPQQHFANHKVNVGGYGLRAGFGFNF